MTNARKSFVELISQVETAKGLYSYIEKQKVPINATDLLRWQWVLTVSALDRYIHDLVREGMVQQFSGKKTLTDKYKTFRISMESYSGIVSAASPEIAFEQEIIRQFSFVAFQYPEKIADALSYIWSCKNKWDIVSANMSVPVSPDDLKKQLKNIVIRRNQIVHEGDCLFAAPPIQQQAITSKDTEVVIDFVSKLVEAIDNSVS